MSVKIIPLGLSSEESHGAFHRLSVATEWIGLTLPSLSFSFTSYVRQEIPFLESLSYFLLDFKTNLFWRYDSQFIVLYGYESSPEWIFIQIAFSFLCGNETTLFLNETSLEMIQKIIDKNDSFRQFIVLSLLDSSSLDPSLHHLAFKYDPSNHPHLFTDSLLHFESVFPQLPQLLKKRIQNWDHLSQRYHLQNHHLPSDEFDYLPDDIRKSFIQQRTEYIHSIIRQSSTFYQQKLLTSSSSSTNDEPPFLDGVILSQHVPPHGDDLITHCNTATNSDMNKNNYNISFATGGTSDLMKYVYRLTWEDEENGRYLAKGLYSQGLRSTDIVMNCLSSGFWGGMHVFNLALKYLGCSVIPLGPNFKNSETIQFIRDLKPSFLLAIPSYLMKLSEYLEISSSISYVNNPVIVPGVITGGEMLYDGMKKKIISYLNVKIFYSTGYTSNETGAIGFKCQHLPWNYFHLHENMQTVEIGTDTSGDGSDCGPIICSNLNRTHMPILRYSIGDSGRIISTTSPSQSSSPTSFCGCGRKLQILELKGRWDDRLRLGGDDIYSSQIAGILESLYGLTLNFSINITKCELTSRDQIDIHVERAEGISLQQIFVHYHLSDLDPPDTASVTVMPPSSSEEEDLQVVQQILTKEFRNSLRKTSGIQWLEQDEEEICDEGTIVPPLLTLLPPHGLKRNHRTGKITRINDRRGLQGIEQIGGSGTVE
jgi:phenylacetate-coenzyme A ligase PaaK-like adenylate-forming protein